MDRIMNRRFRTQPRHAQRGLSLIELMVAITIALFLLAGLLTMLGNTRQTYSAQNQLTQLQDNERLAMTRITDVVQSAGYFPEPNNYTAEGSMPVSAAFPVAGQAIAGTSAAGGDGPDSIDVRFASIAPGSDPDSGTAADRPYNVLDCTGNYSISSSVQTYENLFSIQDGNLVCTLTVSGTVQGTYPIVSGLQNMQIMYGVQTSATVSGTNVTNYMSAADITNWGDVLSVRVTLTFINPLANQPGQKATVQFTRVIAVQGKLGVTI